MALRIKMTFLLLSLCDKTTTSFHITKMRLSLLTLSVAACLVGSVSQIAHADPCTDIQSNCVQSPFNELGIQCSKGGDLTIFGMLYENDDNDRFIESTCD